jgi:cellulose synthase/poly-beta-1,6-N-acetylglucosamine synthase-like glycosyltransferase
MIAAEIVFWASALLIAYTYAGYPLLVFVLGRFLPRDVRKAEIRPTVSLIIAAHNEERDIAHKIQNSLELDYPKDRLEIIVASDCSSDRTDGIVKQFASSGVRLERLPDRLGKSVAQNRAAARSRGEILVFTDATTMCDRNAIARMVRNFGDSQTGCVAGQLIYIDPADATAGKGCRAYWSYEKVMRSCESRLGSLIGVSGCLYAVRRACYPPIALDMSSDFAIAGEIHLRGLRTVYEPDAIATEETNGRGNIEFRMRVRIIEQTFSALSRYRTLLNPFKHDLFALQMISHKVFRYAVPAFLMLLFVSSVILAFSSRMYAVFLAAQLAFYLAAVAGWVCDRLGVRIGSLSLPYYFALANAASLVGFFKFLTGEAHVVWEPLRERGAARM